MDSLRRRLHKGVPLETGDAAFKGLKVEPAGNPRGGGIFRGGGKFAWIRYMVRSADPTGLRTIPSEAQTRVLILESTARCAASQRMI